MELVIFWVFGGILFGAFSAIIAKSRNRSGLEWFLVGLFFGPFGLIVAALPKVEQSNRSGPDTSSKSCPRCKETIKGDALMCRFCNLEFPFVDDGIRDHLLRIKSLTGKGLNNSDIASDLNASGVKCLINDGSWSADIVEKIRNDFAITQR